MRKHKRRITDPDILNDLLERCSVGRLGTNGKDGWPMVKPVNFVHVNGRIYIHSAIEGEKIEQIKTDNRICFEVDLPAAYVRAVNQPCEATFLYRSIIIKGRAVLVEDRAEKQLAIEQLMKKYQPGFVMSAIPEEKLALTAIIGIDEIDMTGKEHFKSGALRESVLNALDRDVPLPVQLDRDKPE